MVAPALTLEKLAGEADVIFKGTAVSSEAVKDAWFKPHSGFLPIETLFKVVTVIKGQSGGETFRFRHYDETTTPQGRMFQPQFYHFEPGRTYIVFAKKSETGVELRQLWENHKSRMDQGVLQCADSNPVSAKPLKEIFWSELTSMLSNSIPTNITYAIQHLQEVSTPKGLFGQTPDFEQKAALASIQNLMRHRNSDVARAAISVIGSENPYLSEERAPFWLATVGAGEITGLGKMNLKMNNVGGEIYWRDLIAIANTSTALELRSLAIRALGLVREPALEKSIERWIGAGPPFVRASAIVLLADFPKSETTRQFPDLANDQAPEVRTSVAQSIGFGQGIEFAPLLGKLLVDSEAKVRQAASMSLLSFSPTNPAIAQVFKTNLQNKEFEPLFLNALARRNPEPYLKDLASVVEQKTNPKNWWGGEIPAFTSWKILFKHLQGQDAEALRLGKFDSFLDAIEKVGNYSSSEPRDIYAFYVQRRMTERATRFRQAAKKAASYDLDYYFNMVDKNPAQYTRE